MQRRRSRSASLSVRRSAPAHLRAPARVDVPARSPVQHVRAGSLLAIPDGVIAGDVRPIGLSADGRVAVYELLVVNETGSPLAAFAYAADRNRPGAKIAWSAIEVPSGSSIAVTIDVALSRTGTPPRVVAELHSRHMHLALDGDDVKVRRRTVAHKMIAGIVAAVVLAVGAVGFAATRPSIVALALPATVAPGKTFSVAYAVGGADQATYTIETPDGVGVRQGTLADRSGAFSVALPLHSAPGGYELRLEARNGFGSAERTARFVVNPQIDRDPVPAKVQAFALERDTVSGGEPIVASYKTTARTGTLKLLDQDGTERAAALLNPHGESIVIAPHVLVDQDFRLVLHAARGGTQAESSLPVRVLHDAAPAAASAPDMLPASKGSAMQTDGPIGLAGTHFALGAPIDVTIVHHEPNLRVTLLDETGAELSGYDVSPGEGHVIVPAPVDPGSYLIVASFDRGFSQQTVVRPISVTGR